MKLIDLSQPIGVLTPPWPTYEPFSMKFFKRLSSEGANGQIITTSNHVGTHMDGELHFVTHGRDIASIPLEDLYGTAAVVDLSNIVEDYDIYTSKMVTDRVDIRQGDILIIHTGYHHYSWDQPTADEVKYLCKHPGPDLEFADWCIKMKLKWIGVDCGSADHPMNTIIRKWRPELAKEAEKKLGRPLEEIFPTEKYQFMHIKLFPHGIIHAENLGGNIDYLLNKRTIVGAFPWKFVGGESCICRIVAFHEE